MKFYGVLMQLFQTFKTKESAFLRFFADQPQAKKSKQSIDDQ